MLTVRCIAVTAFVAVLIGFAPATPASGPMKNRELVATLHGAGAAGRVQFMASPEHRVFHAEISLAPIPPVPHVEASPRHSVALVFMRGNRMHGIGRGRFDHRGRVSVTFDTRKLHSVPALQRGDLVVVIDEQTSRTVCTGRMRLPLRGGSGTQN